MNVPYISKYIPVDREIREGDYLYFNAVGWGKAILAFSPQDNDEVLCFSTLPDKSGGNLTSPISRNLEHKVPYELHICQFDPKLLIPAPPEWFTNHVNHPTLGMYGKVFYDKNGNEHRISNIEHPSDTWIKTFRGNSFKWEYQNNKTIFIGKPFVSFGRVSRAAEPYVKEYTGYPKNLLRFMANQERDPEGEEDLIPWRDHYEGEKLVRVVQIRCPWGCFH